MDVGSIVMKTFFFLITLNVWSQINAQLKNCDSLPWSINYKLKWTDFKATPDLTSEFGAISNISLGYHFSIKKGRFLDSITIEIKSHFYPCLSWRKPEENIKIEILHEQSHFDIAQYYKRLFFKRILESQFTRANIENELKEIYDMIIMERAIADSTYDANTDFGRSKKDQVFWSNEYKKMISSLEYYDMNTIQFVKVI